MAFGCQLYVTAFGSYNAYGCDSSFNGWYNANYQRCCSEGWTAFAEWILWIAFCIFLLVIMILAARARQRRRMMYMEQMANNQQPGAVIIQTTGPSTYAAPNYQQQPAYGY